MAETVDAFFYGLYMDEAVLRGAGVVPYSPRKASARGYALRIGRRATLVKAPGGIAWGMVYALAPDDLAKLYAGPGLDNYRSEEIEVVLENRAIIPARVYNLPLPPPAEERNPDYADKLKAAMTRLGFPADQVARIA